MHQEPLQQKQQHVASRENQGSESEGKSLAAPAFQLKASAEAIETPVQRKETPNGGMPGELVSGFAASTGHDLSDVNVHYNSDKPSQVGALAYAQGNDIHLGAGQEQHLAHEAAHVVQQREGRVQATTEVAGMPVNDNKGLESEADNMGAKAMQMKADSANAVQKKTSEVAAAQFKAAPLQMVLSGDQIGTIAKDVYSAVDGWGTDEEALFTALGKLKNDPNDIASLKSKYKALYGTVLEAEVYADLSGAELAKAKALLKPATTGEANDLLVFPWIGTVYGTAKATLSNAADGKTEVGKVLKGTEVEVLGKEGNMYKVNATLESGSKSLGYMSSANVSSTISSLNETVAAVDATLDKMWTDSFNADKSVVTEYGTAFGKKDGKITAHNVGTGGSGSVQINRNVPAGETFIGDAHTHPYSTSEGSHEGVAFSGGDISNIRNQVKQGYQKLVEAGACRFALVVTNEEKAKKFFDTNSDATVKANYSAAQNGSAGNMQQSVIDAVHAVIGANGSNGLTFYATTDPEKLKFDEK
jgi:hypothetical protein